VFGSMPLVALPANLVAVPLAAPLTIWGLAAGIVGGTVSPYAPQLASAIQLPTVGLLHAIIAVADIASAVPIALDGRALWGLGALAALAAAVRRLAGFGVTKRRAATVGDTKTWRGEVR
jgi:competence protein ComEC